MEKVFDRKFKAIESKLTEFKKQYIAENSALKIGDMIEAEDGYIYPIEYIVIDDYGYFLYYVTSSYHTTEKTLTKKGIKTRVI